MRKDLHLSAGKLAAMVGHCSEAYWTNLIKKNAVKLYKGGFKDWDAPTAEDDNEVIAYDVEFELDKEIFEDYVNGIFTKTICEARNKNHLLKAKEIARELGLVEGEQFGEINDKCLTELTPENKDGTTLVGLWFAPLADEIAHKISKKYQLYKD
jgi:peptidyl-tRNA hydrolase